MKNPVGVLGGLGPLATDYFFHLVIEHTKAQKDQDHIDMILFNHAGTYDRTEYIIGKSKNSPLPTLIEDAKKLEALGCSFIVMPCNTSHYFFDEIKKEVSIPFLNMIDITLQKIKNGKVGIMATDGTIKAKVYEKKMREKGLIPFLPEEEIQKNIMHFIYHGVKSGKKVSKDDFDKVIEYFFKKGCDYVILGCTELSTIYTDLKIKDERIVDSLTSLADATILKCGKELKNG